jgi:hypothetical protein
LTTPFRGGTWSVVRRLDLLLKHLPRGLPVGQLVVDHVVKVHAREARLVEQVTGAKRKRKMEK